jgi:hypothetical protein
VRGVKTVSVSSELTTIQRAVEGAVLLVEVGRQGGVEDEDAGAFVSAILALAACRLRDLGRAARGTLDAEVLWAPHNAAVDDTAPGEEDVILYPASGAATAKKRR